MPLHAKNRTGANRRISIGCCASVNAVMNSAEKAIIPTIKLNQ